MTCHTTSARHCSCIPEPIEDDVLLLATRDPRAAAALRTLAAPLGAQVRVRAEGLLEVTGDVGALLLAAVGAIPAADLLPAPQAPAAAAAVVAERAVPLVDLPHRGEVVAQVDREIARQRPGTTTGIVFCDVSGGAAASSAASAPSATVIGLAAARLRAALRRSDTLGHLGSGLFVAVVADLPVERADEVAARATATVRACFDEPFTTDGGLLVVAPLVGVLVHPGPLARAHLADDLEVDGVRPDGAADDLAPTGADLVDAVERSLARGALRG